MSHSSLAHSQVTHVLETAGIHITAQLKPHAAAALLNLTVESVPVASMQIGNVIYLDNRIPENEQYEQFAHLIHNALIAKQNDLHTPSTEERECFALHYCIPEHMLTSDSIEHIVNRFGVTPAFAAKRLNL